MNDSLCRRVTEVEEEKSNCDAQPRVDYFGKAGPVC